MNTVKVDGMRCQHCVKSVTEALEAMDGVCDVQVNLEAASVTFTGSPAGGVDSVRAAISALGFEVTE